MLTALAAGAGSAAAQTIGTFTWQTAPFCNVVIFSVSVDGAAFRLTGFDDQCGALGRLPAAGSVVVNADGSYAFSFYTVAVNGLANHTKATLDPSSISGPWIDSAGNTGSLTFGVPGPVAGTRRPVPLVSSFALADGAVTMAKVAPGAVDSARIADGTIGAADLANNSVTTDKLAFPIDKALSTTVPVLMVGNTAAGAGLWAYNNGTGRAAVIRNGNVSNIESALDVRHAGSGQGIFVESADGNGIVAYASSPFRAAIIGRNDDGDAVIGFSDGGAGVGAVVGRSNGAGGYGVRGFSTVDGIGVLGQAGFNGSIGTAGKFENTNASNSADVLQVVGNGAGDLIQATQGTNPRFRVHNNGNVTADGTFTGGGADVAEFIEASTPLEPGDVVDVDLDAPGTFRLSTRASSRAVAGVITTHPGLLMNAREDHDELADGPALALAGRVPVKVSAENGAIAPGDLLASSSLPGHAMKAPRHPAPGTVIGKALGALASGTGTIEMLVMLR